MKHAELPLQVGETVVLNDYDAGTAGVIVERLNEDYVRVKWSDFSTATIHRTHGLRRIGNHERSDQASPQTG